jgi:hypothetical protein
LLTTAAAVAARHLASRPDTAHANQPALGAVGASAAAATRGEGSGLVLLLSADPCSGARGTGARGLAAVAGVSDVMMSLAVLMVVAR